MIFKINNKNIYRIRLFLLLTSCFLLPCIVMLLVYHSYGITPFGDKSLLIMDMSAQYSEFFCGLKNINAQNGGILFSWSKVFGSNYAGVFAYYVASPLSFLTLFCPNEYMPIGLAYLTILKIGLCGLTFGILLNYFHVHRANPLSSFSNRAYIIIFSLFYALMSYNIAYSMCLMWIDAVIWLPVIVLGTEIISYGGKPYLLCISFAVLFISTYYISYMVGVFMCMYMIIVLARRHYKKLKDALIVCAKFAGSVITAACLGAWLLLPTYYSLFEGKIGSGYGAPENGLNYEAGKIIRKFLLGTYDAITNSGTPFFYCGLIVFMFFFCYFFVKSISKIEKILTAVITVFIAVSTYYFKIDIMWHVFQKPNWFPYRYFFLFSFIVIFTAAKAFMHFKEIPYVCYCAFAVITAVFYAYAKNLPENAVGGEQFKYSAKFLIIGIILIFTLVIINILLKKCRFKYAEKIAVSVVLICMIFTSMSETYTNAKYITEGLDKSHRYESYEKYKEYKTVTEQLAAAAKEDADGEFYRMGNTFQRNFNESIGLGYGGISHYSSSYNKKINDFLKKIGFAQIYMWSSYAGSTTVTDSIFSVKYVMSDPENSRFDDKGRVISWCNAPYSHYKTVKSFGSAKLYENPHVLPPIIAVSENIKNFDWQANAVESQELLINCMIGGNTSYFYKMTEETPEAVKVNTTESYTEYIITAQTDGPVYAFLPQGTNKYATKMKINGQYDVRLYTGETDCTQFLGSYKKGEEINIKIYDGNLKRKKNAFYQLDEAAFSEAVKMLRADSINISHWSSGRVSGTLNAKEDGAVFTSLVYDESWRVKVDGEYVGTWALKDGLLCFDITKGIHEIEVEYEIPGFFAGSIITSFTLVCILAYIVFKSFIRKKGTCSHD